MKSTALMVSVALLWVCSCSKQGEEPAANQPATSTSAAVRAAPENMVTNAPPINEQTPLTEPAGPIDPKSAEAAGQVVQHYGALIEQKRFAEAAKLWNERSEAAKVIADLAATEIHLEIGKPLDPEGAAGSIYITVPVVFYGRTVAAEPFRHTANLTLRRVNDVPGSTEEQRRWHIERIDWITWDAHPAAVPHP
jgi:hypothetical protein